jgi:hypothetical protein
MSADFETQGELNKFAERSMEAANAWPEHDCHAWNRQHYVSTPTYTAAVCGTCEAITGFLWRSWWMRVRSLFTASPILTKVIDPDP